MDYSQFIFALAVIIIGVVRWFIENRNNAGKEERRDTTDSDLPEWTWPTAEEERTPPPLPSTPPPPPAQRTRVPVAPPKKNEAIPSSSNQGSLSALKQKIVDAKKRAKEAEAQRLRFASKSPRKQIKSATHTPHEVNWLRDPESLRRAVIAREILGPPLALRKGSDIDDR